MSTKRKLELLIIVRWLIISVASFALASATQGLWHWFWVGAFAFTQGFHATYVAMLIYFVLTHRNGDCECQK